MAEQAITTGEWMSALEEAKKSSRLRNADGITTQEMAEAWNISRKYASERLRQLIKLGMAEFVGKRPTVTITGSLHQTPVYKLTAKLKKGKRTKK